MPRMLRGVKLDTSPHSLFPCLSIRLPACLLCTVNLWCSAPEGRLQHGRDFAEIEVGAALRHAFKVSKRRHVLRRGRRQRGHGLQGQHEGSVWTSAEAEAATLQRANSYCKRLWLPLAQPEPGARPQPAGAPRLPPTAACSSRV